MKRFAAISCALVSIVLLAILAVREARSLPMTRAALASFTKLVASANAQDLDAVRALCTGRYVGLHRIERSTGGGVVGLPRNIHKNFQVWREADDVWLCPTNRVGPVYRFTRESGLWKFDGLVGRLNAQGRVEVLEQTEADLDDFL